MTNRQENIIQFRLQDFRDQVDLNQCSVHFLSGQSKALILSCLHTATFFNTRWYVTDENDLGQFTEEELDELENLTDEATEEIIVGCNSADFIKTQLMIVGALTGTAIDLDADLPTGVVDFTATGIAPKLEGADGNIAVAVEALKVALENIQTAVETSTPSDLEDDLGQVWNVLQALVLAMGGTVPVPVPPL